MLRKHHRTLQRYGTATTQQKKHRMSFRTKLNGDSIIIILKKLFQTCWNEWHCHNRIHHDTLNCQKDNCSNYPWDNYTEIIILTPLITYVGQRRLAWLTCQLRSPDRCQAEMRVTWEVEELEISWLNSVNQFRVNVPARSLCQWVQPLVAVLSLSI